MVLRIPGLSIPVHENCKEQAIKSAIASKFEIEPSEIRWVQIKKKSIDARRKPKLYHHLQLDIEIEAEDQLLKKFPGKIQIAKAPRIDDPLDGIEVGKLSSKFRPVIIGSGPAGVFAAYTLARAGLRPIILERGQGVEKRLRKVNHLRGRGEFDPESNYCFGEGGAGTFSDGKLTCGRNHPLIRHLFQVWVEFGAPSDILVDAHPHIGTDYLLLIAKNMRQAMIEMGAEFQFETKLEGIERTDDTVYDLKLSTGRTITTDKLVLALGHSARDTYLMLEEFGLAMEQKPFAMGARIEHPQEVIDQIQYGTCSILPAAEYKLASNSNDRGIWTFCMCPGGHLMPTGAQPGHLAINGMSYHARNSGFANAAVVVNVRREDYDQGNALDGMRYQAKFEKRAFKAGGNNYKAPAQRLVDFIEGKRSSLAGASSTYRPGIQESRMDQVLPKFIVNALREGLKNYNDKMNGYLHPDALIVGLESKTSAPIVMPRTKQLESQSHPGIYPCGEGAGFAGGIVSASLDGVRVGRAMALNYGSQTKISFT